MGDTAARRDTAPTTGSRATPASCGTASPRWPRTPTNAPIVVDHAEGHELIDVDGRRYLDAISSLWVNTLGHRVPELDDALREQLDRGAHSRCSATATAWSSSCPRRSPASCPVDDPHFLYASDGASAVEQALKIAFQYWVNQGVDGRTTFLAFGGAYHGDTIGALSLGDGGFGTDALRPAPVPRAARAAASTIRACFDVADRDGRRARARSSPPSWSSRWCRARPACTSPIPTACARSATACRAHDVLLVCDEVATGFGRTGTLFASEQCGLRPDLLVLGKGLTARLPADVGDGRVSGRVFDAFLGPD